MHALVTGASGFLGGRLVELLQREGVEVTALLRPSSSYSAPHGVRLLRTGLADAPPDAFAPITHIFHCAGCSTDWASAREYQSANIDGVTAMLALAQQHTPRLERFVHVSTTDVFGYPQVAGDERMPHRNVGLPYNHTKLCGEALVWQAIAAGLPATVVRPASIYGPRGKAFVTDIAVLLRQRLMLLVDGGRVPGGFVYVDDVCQAMLLAATKYEALGRDYNLSSIDGVTWNRYTGALAQALGLPAPWLQLPFRVAMALATASELPHRAGLPGRPLLTRHAVYLLGRDQQYCTVRAAEELGWQPRVTLEQGIATSAGWLRA